MGKKMQLIYFYLITCIPLIYCHGRYKEDDENDPFFSDGYRMYYSNYQDRPPPPPPGPPPHPGPSMDEGEEDEMRSARRNNSHPSDHNYYDDGKHHHHHHRYHNYYNNYNDIDEYDYELRDLVFSGGHHYAPSYYQGEGYGINGEGNYAPPPKDPSKYDRYGNYLPDYQQQQPPPQPPPPPPPPQPPLPLTVFPKSKPESPTNGANEIRQPKSLPVESHDGGNDGDDNVDHEDVEPKLTKNTKSHKRPSSHGKNDNDNSRKTGMKKSKKRLNRKHQNVHRKNMHSPRTTPSPELDGDDAPPPEEDDMEE